jgi:hypothetical protein
MSGRRRIRGRFTSSIPNEQEGEENAGLLDRFLRFSSEHVNSLFHGTEAPEMSEGPMTTPQVAHDQAYKLPGQPLLDEPADIRSFIRKYHAFVELTEINNEAALKRLTLSLKGQVNRDYDLAYDREQPTTLEEALHILLEICEADLKDFDDWIMDYSLRQKKIETVDEFIKRFKEELTKVTGMIHEGQLAKTFIRSLIPTIATKTYDHNPRTIRDAYEAARKAERSEGFREECEKLAKGEMRKKAEESKTKPIRTWIPRPAFPGSRMGGAPAPFTRPAPPPPPFRQAIVKPDEDSEVRKLQKQLKGLTLGSTQHQQLREYAMRTGRCVECFERGHIARSCPQRAFPSSSVQTYEELFSEGEESDSKGKQDPEWA